MCLSKSQACRGRPNQAQQRPAVPGALSSSAIGSILRFRAVCGDIDTIPGPQSTPSGLSPAMVDQLVSALLRLKREHTTVLLVEQNFRVAEAVGDDVAVMDEGRIIHAGDMAALALNHGLQHRLLGLGVAEGV